MAFGYPVSVDDLVSRLQAIDAKAAGALGLDGLAREDQKLTAIVWGVGHGSFPVMADGTTFHSGVDIGLPENQSAQSSWLGATVRAIADGEVIYVETGTHTAEGFDYGRVILRHKTPGGQDAYALYQHLGSVQVVWGGVVSAGDPIGTIGWHGDFPHLHFAIASQEQLGGETDLAPEGDAASLPQSSSVFNLLRVKVASLDANEWPLLPQGNWYLYNPIEFVRFCRGEPYLHDIGEGNLGGLKLACEASAHDVQKGDKNEHTVEALLKSEPLKGCQGLLALAHDPTFQPLTRGESDKDAVKAIQSALKALGYDVGRFGPNKDGIDGDFGGTCERTLKKFQKTLKTMSDVLSGLGHTTDDVQESGKLDWLTLLGLDAAVAAHEKAGTAAKADDKPPAPPPATTGPAPAPPKAEKSAPHATAWVFDAKSKKQSMGFGLRLYQALMRWRTSANGGGTGYSAAASFADFETYKKECEALYKSVSGGVCEWPRMDMFPYLTADTSRDALSGSPIPVFEMFGVPWAAAGHSNCCNSQLAAFFVALEGRELHLENDTGPVQYWAGKEDKAKYPGKVDVRIGKKRAMVGFESIIVGNGAKLCNQGSKGSAVAGIQYLGIGDAVPTPDSPYDGKYTNDQAVLKHIRIGDWANYDHHSWLVGEVRYGIWYDGSKSKTPDAFVDQSSFAKDGWSAPVVLPGKSDKSTNPGELSDERCEWITHNEDAFNQRVVAFQAMTELGGKKVDHIQVWKIGVFSANGLWGSTKRAVHGKVYKMKDGPAAQVKGADKAALAALIRPADNWEDRSSDDDAKASWRYRGISNALSEIKPKDPVAFGRFYACVGGPPKRAVSGDSGAQDAGQGPDAPPQAATQPDGSSQTAAPADSPAAAPADPAPAAAAPADPAPAAAAPADSPPAAAAPPDEKKADEPPPEKELFFTVKSDRGEKHAYRVKDKPNAFFYRTAIMTDWDGSPEAYHPDNCYHPKKNPKGKAKDWTANAGHPGNWWGIATTTGKPDGAPYIQTEEDLSPGFYVSPTSLSDHSIKRHTDPRRYVDAGKVPYIVLPPKAQASHDKKHGAHMGDFATVVNMKTKEVHHAIVAESGPGEKLGEGSGALVEKLGKTKGEHDLVYIVHVGSKKDPAWPVAQDVIDSEGARLFDEFGGLDLVEKLHK